MIRRIRAWVRQGRGVVTSAKAGPATRAECAETRVNALHACSPPRRHWGAPGARRRAWWGRQRPSFPYARNRSPAGATDQWLEACGFRRGSGSQYLTTPATANALLPLPCDHVGRAGGRRRDAELERGGKASRHTEARVSPTRRHVRVWRPTRRRETGASLQTTAAEDEGSVRRSRR